MSNLTLQEKVIVGGSIFITVATIVIAREKVAHMATKLLTKSKDYDRLVRHLWKAEGPIILEKFGEESFNILPFKG